MKTSPPQTATQDAKKTDNKNKYFEIPIPRITFTQANVNLYLVILLIVFAYGLGMLTNKVLQLESTVSNQANVQAAGNNDLIQQALNQPTLPPTADVDTGHLPIIGDENAPVTIVEFSDLQCPFCKSFVDQTYPQIYDTYIAAGKVKFAFRHYPLISIHPNAQKAGEAAECANEQNTFWQYHDLLFAEQNSWSSLTQTSAIESFNTYADRLDLNTSQFADCLESGKYQSNVEKDLSAGVDAYVDGTPAFFINGTRITGAQPFQAFQNLIEEELNK